MGLCFSCIGRNLIDETLVNSITSSGTRSSLIPQQIQRKTKTDSDILTQARNTQLGRLKNLRIPNFPWTLHRPFDLANHEFSLSITDEDQSHPVKLEDLFKQKRRQNTHAHREGSLLVIKGKGPGLDYCTAGFKLALDWANKKEYLTEFEVVIVLQGSQVNKDFKDILVEQTGVTSYPKETVLNVLEKHSDKLLVVLVGCLKDEEIIDPVKLLLKKELLSKSTVVLVDNVVDILSSVYAVDHFATTEFRSVHETLGFIQRHIPKFDSSEIIFERLLTSVPKGLLLSYPFYALFLWNYFKDNGASFDDFSSLDTQLKLYEYLISCYKRNQNSLDACGQSEDYSNLLLDLGKISMFIVQHKATAVTEETVKKVCGDGTKVLELGVLVPRVSFEGTEEIFDVVNPLTLHMASAVYINSMDGSSAEFTRAVQSLQKRWLLNQEQLPEVYRYLAKLLIRSNNLSSLFTSLSPSSALYASNMSGLLTLLTDLKENEYSLENVSPFIPLRWSTTCSVTEDTGVDLTTIFQSLLYHGLETKKIKILEWNECKPFVVPSDTEVEVLNVILTNKVSNVEVATEIGRKIKCEELFFTVNLAKENLANMADCWTDIVNVTEVVTSDVISFSIRGEGNFLALIAEESMNGKLKDEEIKLIQVMNQNWYALEPATALISANKVNKFEINIMEEEGLVRSTYSLFSAFVRAAGSSVTLTSLTFQDLTLSYLIVDMDVLNSNGNKKWKELNLSGVDIDPSSETSEVDYLCVFEVYHDNAIRAFNRCRFHVLQCNNFIIHDHLTYKSDTECERVRELVAFLDPLVFNNGSFSYINRLTNLETLMLTIDLVIPGETHPVQDLLQMTYDLNCATGSIGRLFILEQDALPADAQDPAQAIVCQLQLLNNLKTFGLMKVQNNLAFVYVLIADIIYWLSTRNQAEPVEATECEGAKKRLFDTFWLVADYTPDFPGKFARFRRILRLFTEAIRKNLIPTLVVVLRNEIQPCQQYLRLTLDEFFPFTDGFTVKHDVMEKSGTAPTYTRSIYGTFLMHDMFTITFDENEVLK